MNGDGTEDSPRAAVQVQTAAATPLTGVTEMDSGRAHRCAIATDGVYCWGRGDHGQLGRAAGSFEPFATLTTPTVTNAVAVSTETRGTCVVLATGGLTCWGRTPFSGGPDHVDVEAFEPLP
jgi:alpha-tubulin suppressor-like RCC1 family protein